MIVIRSCPCCSTLPIIEEGVYHRGSMLHPELEVLSPRYKFLIACKGCKLKCVATAQLQDSRIAEDKATRLWNECPDVDVIRDCKGQASLDSDGHVQFYHMGGSLNPVFVSMKPNIEFVYNAILESCADIAQWGWSQSI